jgi:hypothetical protein
MDEKIIVSNSTPLINFATVNQLDLLEQLFGQIFVPQAVWDELVIKGADYASATLIKEAKWIKRKSITNQKLCNVFRKELDSGESEAIILAMELNANLILLDETEARTFAEKLGLDFMGSIGCLVLAKRLKIIPQIKPLLDEMISKARFWISKELYETILKDNQQL